MTFLQTFAQYFSYPFVWYALIVGVLIALCSALFGVVLVLKRFSFIGDGLSHVAFGALAIATVMNVTNNMLIVLPITILYAILLLKTGKNTKIKGDAAIAMLSAGALAIGYLIMSIFSGSGNVAGDVCSTLFGSFSIITLSTWEVVLCIALSLIVILSSTLTLPLSIASAIRRRVITFVTLAGGSRSSAFFSKYTVPLSASIRIADLESSSFTNSGKPFVSEAANTGIIIPVKRITAKTTETVTTSFLHFVICSTSLIKHRNHLYELYAPL